jgi:hypothetical protein
MMLVCSGVYVVCVLLARVAVCALAMVMFHEGHRGRLYRFLAGFLLIKRPTLFSLINENGTSFALFQKKMCFALKNSTSTYNLLKKSLLLIKNKFDYYKY